MAHRPIFTRAAVLRALLLAAACSPLAARAAPAADGSQPTPADAGRHAAPKKGRAPLRAASAVEGADGAEDSRAQRPPAKKVAPRSAEPR